MQLVTPFEQLMQSKLLVLDKKLLSAVNDWLGLQCIHDIVMCNDINVLLLLKFVLTVTSWLTFHKGDFNAIINYFKDLT